MPNRIQEKGDLFSGVLGEGIDMENGFREIKSIN